MGAETARTEPWSAPPKSRPPMSHRKSDLGIPCTRKICQSSARSRDARLEPSSRDAFSTDGAAIHLEFELLHRWPRVVPGQPGVRRAPAHDLVGEERIAVPHR